MLPPEERPGSRRITSGALVDLLQTVAQLVTLASALLEFGRRIEAWRRQRGDRDGEE